MAIIGKPNVGKSSILNLLLGTDRAIVTPAPGTTRDIIEDSIQLGRYSIVLQDTAGIRDSSDEVEKIGIARSRRAFTEADLVLPVFDSSVLLSEDDVAITHQLKQRLGVALLNENDLPRQTTDDDLRAIGIGMPILYFSALRADGVERLTAQLTETLESLDGSTAGEELAISRERHREALARALEALRAAKQSALASMPPEIIAVDVMSATDALGQITGEVHTEDVLDAVFRRILHR